MHPHNYALKQQATANYNKHIHTRQLLFNPKPRLPELKQGQRAMLAWNKNNKQQLTETLQANYNAPAPKLLHHRILQRML